jgi:hypothetical protein
MRDAYVTYIEGGGEIEIERGGRERERERKNVSEPVSG